MKKFAMIAAASTMLFSVTACTSMDEGRDPVMSQPAQFQLEGTTWKIQTVNGKPVLKDSDANLRFEGGRLSGTAGCNRLMSGFTQEGDVLTFTAGATTLMACPQPNMEQERAVSAVLVTGAMVTRHSDGRVQIRNPQGGEIELTRMF